MDLDLTGDQELFAETTRRFLEQKCPIAEVRRLHDEVERGFEQGFWREGAELGWTAMLVPEQDGGGSVSGAGLLDLVLVAEEMGRLVSPGPLLPVNVVADALGRQGSPDQRAAVLPGLLSGEQVATWAFAEDDERWDAAGVTLAAREDGGQWVLSGVKRFVEAAAVADWLLVTARTGEGLSQFLIARDTPGVEVRALGSLDFTRQLADVALADVRVPASAVLGEVGAAGDDVERQLEVALALQVAETVGAAGRVLDFTVEYARDRIAFGRPIASYQALKHRFADMSTWMEACAATATSCAKAVQGGDERAPELVSVAKSYVADRAAAIVQDCVQLHGGIGVTWEHDLHLYVRRVAQNAKLYGSVGQHRERLAALIGM